MATKMTVVVPGLPAGFCLSGASIIQLLKQLEVFFPGNFTVFNFGPNEPTIENRSMPWIKTNALTGAIYGIFAWLPTLGVWGKYHWSDGNVPTKERRMFTGSTSDLETYDGGAAGTVSATTGPFWEVDTDWSDKVPIGVGATVTPVNTNKDVFDDAAPGPPQLRSVYMIKPTGRIYDVA